MYIANTIVGRVSGYVFMYKVYIDSTKSLHVSFIIGLKIFSDEITSVADLLHIEIYVCELTSDEKHGDGQFSSQN